MTYRSARILLGLCALYAAGMIGCGRKPAQVAAPAPPVVPVSQPVEREVTNYVDYTGRTDAVNSVGVRARVTGYLTKMPFKEGAEVKKGDLLFEIDPRPYKSLFDQAQGQVNLNQAQLKLARAIYERNLPLLNKGAISAQEIDQYRASVEEAQARVQASEASLEVYRLNLEYTRVTTPIDGQVSRYYYTLGNLVTQDQTLLTTVVSVDPMYAYFDVDERTLLQIRNAINAGKIKAATSLSEIKVLMGLEGEDDFPHHGHLDFVNNVVNPSTGTIAVRGVFENPKPPDGRRLISPGMFVRIRLPIGQPHPAQLVIDRAIGSDQGLKFVYVIDAQHRVRYRRVTTGPLQDDGLRVVEGLEPTDWVVVGALQQVRPNMEVSPEEMAMPVLSGGELPSPVPKTPQPPPPGAKKQG